MNIFIVTVRLKGQAKINILIQGHADISITNKK